MGHLALGGREGEVKSFMPENYTVHENNCDRGRRAPPSSLVAPSDGKWPLRLAYLTRRRRENGREINRKRGTSSMGNESHVQCIKSRSDRLAGPPFTTHSQLSLRSRSKLANGPLEC